MLLFRLNVLSWSAIIVKSKFLVAFFVVSPCYWYLSVGVGVFVIWLSQISSFSFVFFFDRFDNVPFQQGQKDKEGSNLSWSLYQIKSICVFLFFSPLFSVLLLCVILQELLAVWLQSQFLQLNINIFNWLFEVCRAPIPNLSEYSSSGFINEKYIICKVLYLV